MTYAVKFQKTAEKEIMKLPPKLQLEILNAIEQLKTDPRPHGYKQLSNYHSERTPDKLCFRIKVKKDYKIIYTIEEQIVTITIVKVQHRREVYT